MIKKKEFLKKASIQSMSELDKWYMLQLATEMITAVALILFPAGKYVPIKWYQIGRLVKLGRIVVVMVLKWLKK